jgi:hypothetical protein
VAAALGEVFMPIAVLHSAHQLRIAVRGGYRLGHASS